MMSVLSRPYRRIFFQSALYFGGGVGILGALVVPLSVAIIMAVVAGGLFGAGTVLANIRAARRLEGLGYAVTSMNPRQDREILIGQSAAQAFDAALDAARTIRAVRRVDTHAQSGRIDITIGMTAQSWGERVTVQISQRPGHQVAVFVSSRPRVPGVFSDSGKGVENIETFLKSLQERISGAPASACA